MGEATGTAVKAPETTKKNRISQVQRCNFFKPFSSPVEQILFLQRTIGNQAMQKLMKSGALQAKLRIGAPGDIYEQEADRVAEQVMQMPEVSKNTMVSGQAYEISIQRSCPKCTDNRLQEEEEVFQSKEVPGLTPDIAPGLETDINAIRGGGQPLPESARAFFEPRFGVDFSQVRAHSDLRAAEAAQAINAKAFTLGKDIVFGAGQYALDTSDGKRLLAHELTHVVQQSGDHTVRRDLIEDAKKALESKAEEIAKEKLGKLANAPAGPPSGFSGDPKCGPTFCQPFASKSAAAADLLWAGPLILAGIAKKVNTRVVPLWASYLSGGSPPKNLTADFGADFTSSPTTAATTKFLIGELRKDIEANQSALMGKATTITIDFTPRLSAALAAIDDPKSSIPPQMNFNIPTDIAGNIAGGIGKDQTSFLIGAQPSPFNDSREAVIKATLTRNADGSLTVTPAITYTVKDTIDLCPGDCGTSAEQVATVPLSRFEATGLTGDVPLIVQFGAPASELTPFLIPPIATPAPTPVTGIVTASALNIRSAPSTSSSIVGSYPKGTKIAVICRTTGTLIDGNDKWFQTDKGFVSARYVTLSGAATPTTC